MNTLGWDTNSLWLAWGEKREERRKKKNMSLILSFCCFTFIGCDGWEEQWTSWILSWALLKHCETWRLPALPEERAAVTSPHKARKCFWFAVELDFFSFDSSWKCVCLYMRESGNDGYKASSVPASFWHFLFLFFSYIELGSIKNPALAAWKCINIKMKEQYLSSVLLIH